MTQSKTLEKTITRFSFPLIKSLPRKNKIKNEKMKKENLKTADELFGRAVINYYENFFKDYVDKLREKLDWETALRNYERLCNLTKKRREEKKKSTT